MPDTSPYLPDLYDDRAAVAGDTAADRNREPAVRSLTPYYAMLLASLLLPLLLFAGVAWQTRTDMLRTAQSDADRTVETVTQQARYLLLTHQLVAERVSEWLRGLSWDDIARSEAVHTYLMRLRDEYPEVQAIWLADSSGVVRNASEMLPAAPLVVAERNYFQTLRDRDAGTVIGQMVQGKVIKAPNFNVARRREVPDDGFDGVVIVTAFQSFFVKFWQTLEPQPDSLFALYRSDGAVLARLPPVDVEGTVLSPDGPLLQAAAHADQGTIRAVSTLDGIERIVFFRHIPEFNVLVSHGIDLATVFAAWRRLVLYYAAFFALAGASLTALAVLATRGARRLRDEEAKVRTLNQDLRGHAAELEVSNQELQSLSYNISHELRAPLRAIHGFSAILLQNYAETLGAEGRRLLGVVGDAATKMGVLIDDMLDFISTGRQPIKVAEVDMAGQVQDIIAELRDGAGDRRITFEVGALPNARADARMIRRVWDNLLDNAVKFTSSRLQPVINVSARQTADEIVYSVADNGIGFSMQYVGKLFEMGGRLAGDDLSGSGIGLALVRRVVTRHGGRVWAEGKVGEGATFHFSLPAMAVSHD